MVGEEGDGEGVPRPVGLRAVPAVPDPGPPSPPPAVYLRRELKLPTVSHLLRDDDAVRRLPGQARSALRHLQHGDLAAAERVLPGEFGSVLQGPGGERRARRRLARRVAVLLLVLAWIALVAGTWLCSWFPSG